MSKRKIIDSSVLESLKNKEWLENKLINEHYSCSRLAKEIGSSRTTVEKYRVFHNIQQPLSQQELTTINYQNKSEEEKQNILDKRKQTNLDLYGDENTFQSHKDKITKIMQEKYGVDKALQNKLILEKMHRTMMEIHGVEHYAQLHLSTPILDTIKDKHWLIDQHHTNKKTIKQIANELGVDPTTINRSLVKEGIDKKYYYESAQQREVSDWLESLDIVVETNNRKLIEGELDIYLPEYNIAIEYCGVFWHSDAHPRMTSIYHLNKLKQCQKRGIRLLTLYEDEWLYKKEQVKSKILSILGKNKESIFARKCKVVQVINKSVKRNFFDKNHIQGDGPGSITIGLEYRGIVVSMMTFIQKPNKVFDLNRFASSTRVVGGFQKLLKYFQSNYDWGEILSFADLRWSEGNITEHKFKYRRKYLAIFLPNFDPNLSEVQNMRNAGFYRIFNCGLLRYVISNPQL